jgi:hypothetical protein
MNILKLSTYWEKFSSQFPENVDRNALRRIFLAGAASVLEITELTLKANSAPLFHNQFESLVNEVDKATRN